MEKRAAVVPSDQELIQSYVNDGCRQSLDELVTRHLPRVRSLVDAMLLDEGSVDDVTQEVFLRTVRGLPTFENRAAFTTWLYRIALNTIYTHLDRFRRVPRPEHAVVESLQSECAATSPQQQTLLHELEDAVEAALGSLSPKLRAAMILVTQQGLTAAEAAEIEGCAASTLSWRVHAARRQLEQRLKGYLKTT